MTHRMQRAEPLGKQAREQRPEQVHGPEMDGMGL